MKNRDIYSSKQTNEILRDEASQKASQKLFLINYAQSTPVK